MTRMIIELITHIWVTISYRMKSSVGLSIDSMMVFFCQELIIYSMIMAHVYTDHVWYLQGDTKLKGFAIPHKLIYSPSYKFTGIVCHTEK